MGRAHSNRGFTLVEAALTIALVGLALTATLQILQGSKLTAAHTRDQKTARVLALKTLGEIESGLRWDELEQGAFLSGTYAEEDYPAFLWELAIGDQSFSDQDGSDPNAPFDNWAWQREREQEREYEEESGAYAEDSEQRDPFEKVRVRVIYPKYSNLPNELVLERWIRWDQVYRPLEEEEVSADLSDSDLPSGDAGSDTVPATGNAGGGL